MNGIMGARLKVSLGALATLFCAHIFIQNTFAAQPFTDPAKELCRLQSASQGDINSQWRACNFGPAGGARGAIWFNESQTDRFKPDVTIEDSNITTLPVYIRGDFYSWSNTRGSSSNPISVRAVDISISDPAISGLSSTELYRGQLVGTPNTWSDAHGGASEYITAQLNVTEFKKTATDCGSNCLQRTIAIYRCWWDSQYGKSADGCGTDEVMVTLNLSPELTPESWISANGTSFAKTDIFAAPGDTVYFRHSYKKSGEGNIPDCMWWIYQSSANGAPNNSLASGIPTNENRSYNDCKEANIQSSDGNLLQTSHGTRIQMSFTIPNNAQTGWRWCQRAAYRNQAGLTWGEILNHQAEPRVCVEVKTKDIPPDPIVSSCPLPSSAYSVNKGGTQAGSGVRNMTAGSSWTETTETNHLAAVWAKPGDSVQFKHTLCFGAQAVRGSNDPGSSGVSTPGRPLTTTTANTATIRAFTAPATPNSNYLFGSALTGAHTQSFNLGIGTAQPSAVSTADNKGDYYFTYYSPSTTAGNRYRCDSDAASFPAFINNGYQIPNFIASTKPAGCNSVAPSDVGKIIEQDLDWNNVQTWVSTYSNGGFASCGCDSDVYAVANLFYPNYNQASTDGRASGYTAGRHVLGCYTSGSCGCCGEYCEPCLTQYGTIDYWYYPLSTTSVAGPTKKAQVKTPFNYTTTTSAIVPSHNGSVYGGEDLRVETSVQINARSDNPNISGDYATISKPSTYEIVSFTIPAEPLASAPGHLQGNRQANPSIYTKSTPACSYYANSIAGANCQSVRREENAIFNASGKLSNPDIDHLLSLYLNIPDVAVGTKFCVAVGVWPSDSHDDLSDPSSNDIAMTTSNPGTWNYSKASCVTIAKKPSVEFWGQSVYTAGGIITSTSKKNLNHNILGNNIPCSFASYTSANYGNCGVSALSNNGTRRVFGSWSEYDTIAKEEITGFATGAGYGYERNNRGTLAPPGGYPNVNFGSDPNTCVYSSQTFNNDQCTSKIIGKSSINNVGLEITLSRLTSRYILPAVVPQSAGASITNASFATLDNDIRYVKSSTSTIISADLCIESSSIIDVVGDLTINGNITYGTGPNCTPVTYTGISELPQLLIFTTGNIIIGANVTNIDSWLIAGHNGDKSISTCPNLPASSNDCASQLTINGPVFASKLYLNRTAGALPGNGSITPAEIFNLRPDTYLWAYNQAQRFSQAVTTYSRELAPRF